jgi:Tfp pilus assembly protein PilO
MVDFRDPKIQVLLIIAIIFVALIYVWYSQFYSPYAAKLAQKIILHEKLRSELFAVKQKAKSLEGLKEEYTDLSNRFERVKLWLPEKKEDESFLAQLHIAAQLTNTQIVGVIPREPIKKDFYNANVYEVRLEATYHGLGNFFAKVVNFPFIVTISDVLMEKSKETGLPGNEKKQRDHTVYSAFKLTTYNSHTGGQTQ